MTADCGTLHFEEAARVTVVPYADGLIALCTTAIAAPEGPEARARERRQAEHAAGQYALITSLAALGVHAGPPDRRPDGSPRPPPGTLVSISHRFPYAVAAAWKAHGRPPQHCRILGVGVDIEQEGTIPENAVHLVCSPVERPGLCATPGGRTRHASSAARKQPTKPTPNGGPSASPPAACGCALSARDSPWLTRRPAPRTPPQ